MPTESSALREFFTAESLKTEESILSSLMEAFMIEFGDPKELLKIWGDEEVPKDLRRAAAKALLRKEPGKFRNRDLIELYVNDVYPERAFEELTHDNKRLWTMEMYELLKSDSPKKKLLGERLQNLFYGIHRAIIYKEY